MTAARLKRAGRRCTVQPVVSLRRSPYRSDQVNSSGQIPMPVVVISGYSASRLQIVKVREAVTDG